MKTIAVITGASSGIGREFVRQIDGTYYGSLDEIWVLARREDKLNELARQTYTKTRVFVTDFSDLETLKPFIQALADDKPAVSLLVNAAGWGRFEPFAHTSEEHAYDMTQVNCQAVVEMCYHTLPYMNVGSKIINIASGMAFLPAPGSAIYAADKAFVLSFGRALHYELKDVGITVTTVCPKATATEFFNHVGISTHTEVSVKFFGIERPYDVVQKALTDAQNNKDLSISSIECKALHVASKVLPTQVLFALGNKAGVFI